jgi:hypothetical protein
VDPISDWTLSLLPGFVRPCSPAFISGRDPRLSPLLYYPTAPCAIPDAPACSASRSSKRAGKDRHVRQRDKGWRTRWVRAVDQGERRAERCDAWMMSRQLGSVGGCERTTAEMEMSMRDWTGACSRGPGSDRPSARVGRRHPREQAGHVDRTAAVAVEILLNDRH